MRTHSNRHSQQYFFSLCHDRVITNGEWGLERSNGSTIECVCLCCYVSLCVCVSPSVCVYVSVAVCISVLAADE